MKESSNNQPIEKTNNKTETQNSERFPACFTIITYLSIKIQEILRT